MFLQHFGDTPKKNQISIDLLALLLEQVITIFLRVGKNPPHQHIQHLDNVVGNCEITILLERNQNALLLGVGKAF